MPITHLLKDLIKLKLNYNIGEKTWFGTGGKSKVFLLINDETSLRLLMKFLPKSIPIFLIGAGSNILIRDGGLNAITIKLGAGFKKINFLKNEKTLEVGAAVKDFEFSKYCFENSICDFEFLRGIPGTIGGNIRMNAGCFGHTISDRLLRCGVLKRNGNLLTVPKKKITFKYRTSSLPKDSIILKAKFKISFLNKKIIKKKIDKIIKKRKETQPVNSRTGGSTFKNPPKQSAWELIERINFRGKNVGGARVSEHHTNFLINNGNANSLDIELLGEEIRKEVKKQFNVELDWELIRVGQFNKI